MQADLVRQNDGITATLNDWSGGDAEAFERLVPLIATELRRLAGIYLSGRRSHTLQPTALVNELYVRLLARRRKAAPGPIGPGHVWPDRGRFFSFAARTMRNILVDHARIRHAVKRGAGMTMVALDEEREGRADGLVDLIALDEALTALAARDPRQSRIVELRAFAGLTLRETADCLDVSDATISRDWAMAKAWLRGRMTRKSSAFPVTPSASTP